MTASEHLANFLPIYPACFHTQRYPTVFADIGCHVEARVFQEDLLQLFFDLQGETEFTLILFKNGEGFSPDLKRGMAERYRFGHIRQLAADFPQPRE